MTCHLSNTIRKILTIDTFTLLFSSIGVPGRNHRYKNLLRCCYFTLATRYITWSEMAISLVVRRLLCHSASMWVTFDNAKSVAHEQTMHRYALLLITSNRNGRYTANIMVIILQTFSMTVRADFYIRNKFIVRLSNARFAWRFECKSLKSDSVWNESIELAVTNNLPHRNKRFSNIFNQS